MTMIGSGSTAYDVTMPIVRWLGHSGAVIGLTGLMGAAWLAAGSVNLAPTESSHAADKARIALDAPQDLHTITGTLSKLDVEAGKGILTTDLDKPVFFRLTRPDLFERLSIGDRITIQLDDEGRAVKVIEALPAEVHEPPPPPK
jgi:hypothetical protein